METTSIIVSIITGIFSVTGVVIATAESSRKLQQKFEVALAVMDTRLESLMAELRTVAESARQVPVLQEQIKSLTQRVEDLEREKHEHH